MPLGSATSLIAWARTSAGRERAALWTAARGLAGAGCWAAADARRKALLSEKKDAEETAQMAGVTLGRLKHAGSSVSASSDESYELRSYLGMRIEHGDGDEAVSATPRELTFTVYATATFDFAAEK